VTLAITTEDERLSEIFGALSNSTRRAILSRLAAGAATVNELAEPFGLSLPAISRHLKVLGEAGLISRRQKAQFRPCALEPDCLLQVSQWVERCRADWETSLDRMDVYLQQLQAGDVPKGTLDDR